ncbi:MAG: AhpC/TSA family protein [Prevotella sp.]|nr:AhpC/TSA family protein [Prevotella sp.]
MKANIHHLVRCAVMTAATILLASCDNTPKFQVSGTITEAADSLLIFEDMALDGPQLIDTLRLDAGGAFSFTAKAPEGSPGFYRLRIGGQIVNVAVDSTETITVKASYPTMASQYTIEGNDDCAKIKELTMLQMDLQARAQAVANDPTLTGTAPADSILRMIATYQQKVTREYIYKEPMRAYSYFALFQGIAVNQAYIMVFDPRQRMEDARPFQAVATSWDQFYPNSLRTKNLHNIAVESIKTQNIINGKGAEIELPADKVSEADLIDLPLTDNKGALRHLTELKGKVVLLDFHVFAADDSPARIMMLRELYNKYHDRGLEIYQVSLDSDEHFWKTQTAALPWISVRDSEGRSNAYLSTVESVPCSFIINRDNQVVMGASAIKNLDTDIAKYL